MLVELRFIKFLTPLGSQGSQFEQRYFCSMPKVSRMSRCKNEFYTCSSAETR